MHGWVMKPPRNANELREVKGKQMLYIICCELGMNI